MKKKVIPYCPKPRNAFERGLFKYFEGKKDKTIKRRIKKKSKKRSEYIFRKNKTGT